MGDCSLPVPSCPNALVQFSWTSTGKPETPVHHSVPDRSRPFAYLSLKQVRKKLASRGSRAGVVVIDRDRSRPLATVRNISTYFDRSLRLCTQRIIDAPYLRFLLKTPQLVTAADVRDCKPTNRAIDRLERAMPSSVLIAVRSQCERLLLIGCSAIDR